MEETPGRQQDEGERESADARASRQRHTATLLRIGLPGAAALAGAIVLAVGPAPVGAVLIGAAAVGALTDLFARLTIESGRDRDREERARDTFKRTGRWPGNR